MITNSCRWRNVVGKCLGLKLFIPHSQPCVYRTKIFVMCSSQTSQWGTHSRLAIPGASSLWIYPCIWAAPTFCVWPQGVTEHNEEEEASAAHTPRWLLLWVTLAQGFPTGSAEPSLEKSYNGKLLCPVPLSFTLTMSIRTDVSLKVLLACSCTLPQ